MRTSAVSEKLQLRVHFTERIFDNFLHFYAENMPRKMSRNLFCLYGGNRVTKEALIDELQLYNII